MGGDPQRKKDRIENLMAICRSCHIEFGNQKKYNSRRLEAHKTKMILSGVNFCEEWIDNQINRYE